MAKIRDKQIPGTTGNVTGLIGGTPLVRINRSAEGCGVTIAGKMESFNPSGTVKHRIGLP